MKFLLLLLPLFILSEDVDLSKLQNIKIGISDKEIKNLQKGIGDSDKFKYLERGVNSNSFQNLDKKDVSVEEFRSLDKRDPSTVEQFKSLDRKDEDVSKFKHLDQLSPTTEIIKMKKLTENRKSTYDFLQDTTYTDGYYLTKEEFESVKKKVSEASREIAKTTEFLIVFTSASVPTNTMLNNMHSISILQDNKIDIESVQFFYGFPNNLEDYLKKTRALIDTKSTNVQKRLEKNLRIKINPALFDFLKIKKAPALALARCTSLNPSVDSCEFKYLIRGDVSLLTFFDKIIEEDKSYQKYYDALIANKILTEGF